MKSLEQWVSDVSLEQLPVLRRTALSLGYLAKNAEGISAADIGEVVLNDPLMTLKVIAHANGRVHGHFGAEIATVHAAVIMVGVPPFFKHFRSLKSIEELRPLTERESQGLLNCLIRVHHAAWQARDLAILRADIKSEEVYVGTLLHDMGEMVMWCVAPEMMLKILKAVRRQQISREDAEKALLGFTLWDFQQALVEKWKLPELLVGFMDNQNSLNPRSLMAIIGSALARHAALGWHSPKLLADYEVIAGQFNFSTDEVIDIVHRNAIIQGRHWEAFHVPPAAAWLPMLPGEWPVEPDDEEESEIVGEAACLLPHPEELRRVMDEIAAHLNGTLDLHEMMSLVLKGMHEGIGLNRVVFALLTADRSALRAKYVVGAEEGSPLRGFGFDMRTPHLFARLLGKMQSVWVNADNAANFAALLPDEVSRVIGGKDGFFAMSIFVHDRPVGLMYADRRHGHCDLDEHSYQEFKRLCLRAAQGLGHLGKK